MTKPRFIVFPLRFTNDAPTMVAFLETMGLHKAVSTKSDGFAVLHGRSGAVMVHGTQTAEGLAGHGSTTLNFAVANVAAAAEHLNDSGYEMHAWDESYGKQGVVRHPSGQLIGLNAEDEEDLYGYQVHPRTGTPTMDVVAVCASPDFVRDADYFAAFGFHGTITNPYWCGLRAPEPAGVVGLRSSDHDPVPPSVPDGEPFGPPYLVDLGFETQESLDDVAQRLRKSGFAAMLVTDDAAHVAVTDPDGHEIQIHRAP